ncbi:MAG: hypothetical protein ACRDIA_01755 [Actinomycetota bacterium]
MIIHAPRAEVDGTSAVLDTGRKRYTIRWRIPGDVSVTRAGDSFFVAGLLPSMASPLGSPPQPFTAAPEKTFVSETPVSPRLLQSVPAIQDIYLSWDRHHWRHTSPERRRLRRVRVEAAAAHPSEAKSGDGAASFFTAGVDSFYTALKHRDEIKALIYVEGFEYFDRPGAFDSAIQVVRGAAEALGKPLIELSTNLPTISGHFLPWGHYHGAALASAAVLLSGNFQRVLIPATNTYNNLVPLGSHPMTDPLWSTDSVQIVHDGCEANRIEKLTAISGSDAVRSFLRVCHEQPIDRPNCSSCEKCLRTMISLEMVGTLDRFKTFSPLDPETMDFSPPHGAPAWRRGWQGLLRELQSRGGDRKLEDGIKRMLETGTGTTHGGSPERTC